MSDDVIISVEHLSKRYRLGQIGATSLRESAERLWHRLRGRDPAEHMGQIDNRPLQVRLRFREPAVLTATVSHFFFFNPSWHCLIVKLVKFITKLF
jgi:hypothetical protein